METEAVRVPDPAGSCSSASSAMACERHGADAALGLGALDPSVAERPPHVDNTGGPVDITLLKRDPLPGPQPGRRREDHEGALSVRPVGRRPRQVAPMTRTGRFSVRRRCGLSTPCLAGLTSIIPQSIARPEHLPKRLGRLEAVTGRDRHPPGGDLLRTQLAQTLIPELADGLRQEASAASRSSPAARRAGRGTHRQARRV